jgi:SRSO17 transposase
MIKFRSISEIATEYGEANIDGLHHFMQNSPVDEKDLHKANREAIAFHCKGLSPLLIIDDTPCPRKGKEIEGIGIHHGANGFVKL